MTATLSTLLWLIVVVTFGAVVPIVPTGAAVSGAAAYAAHQNPLYVLLVVVAGAGGAYVGDLAMYAICRWGGEQLARRLRWLRDPERMERMRKKLDERQVSVLLVSRLLPGGRVPVLLAAALMGLDWRRFAVTNLPACLLWSTVYAGIGIFGYAIFPEPWQSVVAAILLVLLISQIASMISRRREATAEAADVRPRQKEA
ncbi:VTT domain-containing protein [Phytohabitans flavus]|uniref:Membrane protein n=1 Tax=Phytohabitans flavus TaxID=1076124 RepID=A0A6F8Y9H3_9ACTN|nr:VTT domain-containing protein [Phytohabitans flavus]BCB82679.1 membrane protein [Phytohabitans flavus]